MFNSSTLDIAIGLSLVYLLTSLFCLAVNELIASATRARAKNLEEGIRNLLMSPPASPDAAVASPAPVKATGAPPKASGAKFDLAHLLYAQPFIRGLYRNERYPSYIPSRAFALALMNLVAPSNEQNQTMDGVRKSIENLNSAVYSTHIKEALLAMVDRADGKRDRLRLELEAWYDQTMDRVAGWYKRKIQLLTWVVAVASVVALNVDTIAIVRHLSSDPARRAALVVIADDYIKSKPGGLAPASSGVAASFQANVEAVSAQYNQANALALPLGWSELALPSRSEDGLLWWLNKILGLLLTTFAVSLGAPFWFDVLNKIVVIRSTVKPREKSPEEASKD